MAASKKKPASLKALTTAAGEVGKSRLKWVFERGVPELIDAYRERRISLHRADIVAHLSPDNQREELKKLVVGKDKVTVLPATEKMLIKAQHKKEMEALILEGLNEFEREFRKEWLRLRRKYGTEYTESQMWRRAEDIIFRLSAPKILPE